jgi:hypothetical protein
MTTYDQWKTTEPPPDKPDDDEPERCPGCGANQDDDEDCASDCPEYLAREAEAEQETNLEVSRDYRANRSGR